MRLQIANLLACRHLPRNTTAITITAVIISLPFDNGPVVRRNLSSLILSAMHKMLEVDLGAFEPFARIDNPPNKDKKLITISRTF